MKKFVDHLVKRPIKNFNAENRALKYLEGNAEKSNPAPRHPSSAHLLEQHSKEHPDYLTLQKVKSEELHERLKNFPIYDDHKEVPKSSNLPQSRKKIMDPQFGFLEPEFVPPGKVTLKTMIGLIGLYYSDRDAATAEIANAKLNEEKMKVVFDTVHLLKVHQADNNPSAEEDPAEYGLRKLEEYSKNSK